MAASAFDLITDLGKGNRHPVYFLYGEERFFQTELVQQLRQAIITPDNQDFNLEVFDGKTSGVGDWVSSARMISFLGGDKLVVVHFLDEASLDEKDVKELLAYVADPVPETCLILTARKADRKRKLYKGLTKLAGAAECTAPKDRMLIPWLRTRARQAGRTLEPGAAEALLNRVGARPGQLASELEKVITFAGDSKSLSESHVMEVVGDIKMEKVFALTDALKTRNAARAVSLLHNQLDHGEEPLKILGMIAWQFRMIWEVKHHQEHRLNKQQIAQKIGANPFVVEQAMRSTRNFNQDQLRSGFRELAFADRQLKTTGQSAEGIMEALVLRLCSARG